MIHADLVNIAFGAHGGVAGLAFLGFIKYGLWASEYKDWQTNSKKAMHHAQRLLAVELGERLNPVLNDAGRVVLSEIVDAYGSYREKEVDPTKSEDYRNALFDFVEGNVGEMARYARLLRIHALATFWRKALTWTIFILLSVQALLLVTLLMDLMGLFAPSNCLVCWSLLPTCLSAWSCLLCLALTVHYHNKGSLYFVEEVEPSK